MSAIKADRSAQGDFQGQEWSSASQDCPGGNSGPRWGSYLRDVHRTVHHDGEHATEDRSSAYEVGF